MTQKQRCLKRYWPDGAAQRAKCPKCGKLARRMLINNGRSWMYDHGSTPGIMGLREGHYCFVLVTGPESAEISKIARP
jgi:hypothetical protein